jgi:hypothetical protein
MDFRQQERFQGEPAVSITCHRIWGFAARNR